MIPINPTALALMQQAAMGTMPDALMPPDPGQAQAPSDPNQGSIPSALPSLSDVPTAPADPQAGFRQALEQGLTGASGPPIPKDYADRIQKIQAMTGPTPAELKLQEAMKYNPPQQHGLKAHLLGLLKGFATGGIPGAIMGTADPTMANRAWYRATIVPGLEQNAAVERGVLNNQEKAAGEIANRIGIDPTTGLTTPGAMYKQQQLALGQGRLGATLDRNATYKQHIQTLQADKAKAQIASDYKNGMFGDDPETLSWAADQLGIPGALKPAFIRGEMKSIIDANGNLGTQNLRTGEVQTATGANGQPVGSFAKTQEAGRNTRAQANLGERTRHNKATEGIATQRLSDSEEKEIDTQARKNAGKPPSMIFNPDGYIDAQKAYQQKIESERQRLRAEKLQGKPAQAGNRAQQKATQRIVKASDIPSIVQKMQQTNPNYTEQQFREDAGKRGISIDESGL